MRLGISIFVVTLVAAIAWCGNEMSESAAAWAARHGKCLHWTVISHVPVHHYQCDQWERP